jgi:hypothetical protein
MKLVSNRQDWNQTLVLDFVMFIKGSWFRLEYVLMVFFPIRTTLNKDLEIDGLWLIWWNFYPTFSGISDKNTESDCKEQKSCKRETSPWFTVEVVKCLKEQVMRGNHQRGSLSKHRGNNKTVCCNLGNQEMFLFLSRRKIETTRWRL